MLQIFCCNGLTKVPLKKKLPLQKRSKMNRKWLYYGVFFAVLIGGFYFTMTKLIPGYEEVKLPVLSYVRPFSFINQDGQNVTETDLKGRVYVTEFFFTTCPNICPMLNNNMKVIYEKFKSEPDFVVVSHTCDPDRDSFPVLKQYSDSLKVDNKKWWFLTGRKDSLYLTARNSYLLDDPKNGLQKIEDQFMHTQFFALIDRNGRVRKIYDGLKKKELKELEEDIPRILKEKAMDGNFSNNLFSK